MSTQTTQIVATIGPASEGESVLRDMVVAGLDIVRLNFAWSDLATRKEQILRIRAVATEQGKVVQIMQDLPGSRIQEQVGHTYDPSERGLTARDRESIVFGAKEGIEYLALSFVGSAADVIACRAAVAEAGGSQKIIAKIERRVALDALDEIIAASDAIMIARGDLGEEVPLEDIPFIEKDIIARAHSAGKPVITATQMLLSMIEHTEPTRAEVTDVVYAVECGSDAVMLSDETAAGHHPVEAVLEMRRIITVAEAHTGAMPSYLL